MKKELLHKNNTGIAGEFLVSGELVRASQQRLPTGTLRFG